MKLSGHSYNNDVFGSLLDNMSDEIVVKSQQTKKTAAVAGLQVFSSTTEDDNKIAQMENISKIASELQYAADNANVSLTKNDLVVFAKQAEQMKGKELERAARKYCSQLDRETAAPSGDHRNPALLDQLHNHAVIPAGYNTEHGQNDSKTGGYMGMSKNPNTIWDSEALTALASTIESRSQFGDEQIKKGQIKEASRRAAIKESEQAEKDQKFSDTNLINSGIRNISTGLEASSNQPLPKNAMSMFSDNMEFENIPDQTVGEMLKSASEKRSAKSGEAKEEWNQVKSAQKTNNSIPAFFAGNTQDVDPNTKTQREGADHIFEFLTKK